MEIVVVLAILVAASLIFGLIFFCWFCNQGWRQDTVVVHGGHHPQQHLQEVHYHQGAPTTTVYVDHGPHYVDHGPHFDDHVVEEHYVEEHCVDEYVVDDGY